MIIKSQTSKKEVDAHELSDVHVEKVALVRHGANRVPFRITKSEAGAEIEAPTPGGTKPPGGNSMLNFAKHSFSKVFKAAPADPSVVAVIVSKSADLDALKPAIVAGGFSVDQPDESQDGVVIFAQKGADSAGEDTTIVKVDDNVAVAVTGISKAFEGMNFESGSFLEVMSQEGFRPGIGMSIQLLDSTISNILNKAENRDQLATEIGAAVAEFQQHLVALAQAVPPEAFSAELLRSEGGRKPPQAPQGAKPGAGTSAPDPVQKAADDAKAAAEALAKANAAGDAKGDAKSGEDVTAVLAGELQKVNAAVASLAETVAKSEQSSASLAETVSSLAKQSAETAAKMSSLVGGKPASDPVSAQNGVAKSERVPALIDTAYARPKPLNS